MGERPPPEVVLDGLPSTSRGTDSARPPFDRSTVAVVKRRFEVAPSRRAPVRVHHQHAATAGTDCGAWRTTSDRAVYQRDVPSAAITIDEVIASSAGPCVIEAT